MAREMDMIYVVWACRETKEAKKIIYDLLDRRLIACASIFPEVESIYRWKDTIEESQEVKVVLKTIFKHFDAIQAYIQKQCSYEVPEIIQIDIVKGNARYLSWIVQETASISLSTLA